MNTTYYYLLASPSFSGLSTMASKIMTAAKNTYDGCVMNEIAIMHMLETLKASAEEMKKENPRWRIPRIAFVKNDYSDNIHITIDNWSFIGYKVKDIVGYVG